MKHNEPAKHNVIQSVFYHIFPGLLIGVFYFLVRQPIINLGFPSLFALMLAALFVLIPFELGFLLYQGKKSTGRFTLSGLISYKKPVPFWQIIVWVLGVFLITGLIFTLLKPVDIFLKNSVFAWVPSMQTGLEAGFEKSKLIITYLFVFLIGVILAPLTEELYFRGYLLPRVPGKVPMLLHSLLFALYHVFTPWMFITRTIGMLPIVYAVKKKNILIGIIVHMLINSIDVISAVIFISTI